MKWLSFSLFYSLIFLINTYSQSKKEDFQLMMPEVKVSGSLYNKILVIDSRPDTSNLGVVQKGALNRLAKVVPLIPIGRQIENTFYNLIDSTSKDNELIMVLRHFSFAEVTNAFSEKGYCYFNAELFGQVNKHFQKISNIDTVVTISGLDVTKGIMKKGSQLINELIAHNIFLIPTFNKEYTFEQVAHIDDYEKQSIPLYTTEKYNEGLYLSYYSFKSQQPDISISDIEAKIKLNPKNAMYELISVKKKNNNGEFIKLKSYEFYALTINNQMYIATDCGYYHLYKMNNDFYFTGMANVQAASGEVITASVFFGIIGMLATMDQEGLFFMKIDHRKGDFIRIKRMKIYKEF